MSSLSSHHDDTDFLDTSQTMKMSTIEQRDTSQNSESIWNWLQSFTTCDLPEGEESFAIKHKTNFWSTRSKHYN